jgi:hypothetical protein
MICPIVNGSRQAIPLDAKQVYSNSDGSGGTGEDLAHAIFDDLDSHVGIKGKHLLQMQGKVMDGQYLNSVFTTAMNTPVMNLLDDKSECKDEFWWPVQWDPGYWLDKVFAKYKETEFVDRLLKRVALFKVDKRKFSDIGAWEFRQCVEFVSQLPHVQEQSLELGGELSSVVYWRLKTV